MKLKNKINLILAINDEDIVYYYFTSKNINSQVMQKFFEDLVEKIGNDIKNML